MAQRRSGPQMWVTLAAALAAIVALIIASEAFSFATSLRTQGEVHRLVQTGERSTFLIGALGQHTARLHASLLEARSATPEVRDEIRERMGRTLAELDAHARELPGLLSDEERRAWQDVELPLATFVRRTAEALALHDADQDDEAALEEVARLKRQILEGLRISMALNQGETALWLARTEDLMARARLLEVVVALLLFASVAVIAGLALRGLRRKERELAGYLRKVEDTNSELDAFAGRVAHDLQNTLGTVNLAGNVLRAACDDPSLVAETGARLERTSRRADELVTGLLAFARAGAPSASGARAEVARVVEEVLEELAPARERLEVEVEVDVSPPGLAVRCEPALLRVLLFNLLSNAVKFLDGRPTRHVRVSAAASAAECHIEVTDTGPGIPRALLGRIFEPFFRVPGVAASGQGIGLATALRIAEAHGGTLRVSSDPGRGASFRAVLPLDETSDPAVSPRRAPPPPLRRAHL